MRNIFIFHGSYGHPLGNWFPWLKEELEKLGNRVFVPQFPIPKTQNEAFSGHSLQKWLKSFAKYRKFLNDKTIIIAHSRGCVFAYHLLPTLKTPINCLILVAPWMTFRWYPKDWKKTDSFHKKPFEWDKIKENAKYTELYQSTNDDTPVSEGREIAGKLGAKLIAVKNAGHFNVASNVKFKKFPLLLNKIKLRLDNL